MIQKRYQNSYTQAGAELTKLGMHEAVKDGRSVSKALLGYRNFSSSLGEKMVVLDEKAPLVQLVLEQAGTDLSMREVQEFAHSIGLTGRDGKPLCLSTLHSMLTNPFYAGMIRYQGELYPGKHQSLISKTLFDTIQRNLKKRRH